ncbi:MAG: Fe-S cluster assembly protein SufD [Chitinophagaceae bacterium]|nr:Fe-S cluster assembly protein SufD [Chitinophagaceae bacterium]MCW5927975.1 Fe-S cluster assembly protein SufD [Chitinophagaceae bacterium]
MITTTSLYDQLLAVFQERDSEQQQDWLKALKKEAFNGFEASGFPTIKNEDWRFTNVAPFLKDPFKLQPANIPLHEHRNYGAIPGLDAHEIILKNGLLNEDVAIAGLKVTPFRTALGQPALQNYLGKTIPLKNNGFAALNTALFQTGVVIEVEKNAIIDKPVRLIHVYNAEEPFFVQPRVLIVANGGSRLEVVETLFVKGNEPVFINTVSEIHVAANARLDHYNLQVGPSNVRIVNFTQVDQSGDSLYNNHTYTLPGISLVRNNLHLELNGSNTESHLYGLYLTGGNQLVDNHSLVNHKMPHCMSNELYKGVLMDESRAVFNGKIFVQQDAQKTNAFQQNNNMLLSDRAVIDTKPQLEIFADDVKCSHGSTIGSFNPEALFYLKTRGIGEIAARNLLVNAFAFDVTSKAEIPAVRNYIDKLITQKMAEAYD